MFRATLKAIAIATFISSPLGAQGLPTPVGDVLLTVTGNVGNKNTDNGAQFDLEMLEKMTQIEFETTTIWTDGSQKFQGVSLATLLEELEITGTYLRATAINDYSVEIPMSDALEGQAIIAYLKNDEIMSIRDKGPLWIVYPYDSDVKFRTEVVYARSIWQLDRVEALD